MKKKFKISVLVFVENIKGELLLLQRNKSPNLGLLSPIGGKLEMDIGESPFECAIRETKEEIGLNVKEKDLHLFATVSEKSYEGKSHWLMFLFNCKKKIKSLPKKINEGIFKFYTRSEIENLPIPETDKEFIWKIFDRHKDGFVCVRAECGKKLKFKIEQTI